MFKRFTPVTHSNIWTRPRGPRSAARFIGTSVIGVMRQGPGPTALRALLSLLLHSILFHPSFPPSSTESNAKSTPLTSLSLSPLDSRPFFSTDSRESKPWPCLSPQDVHLDELTTSHVHRNFQKADKIFLVAVSRCHGSNLVKRRLS